MRLTFYGAARTVTGSRHLLEVNGQRILLDCGLFQGRRADTYELNQNFPFDPDSVDLLVLSHAHIDHSGNIPALVKNGFRGDILCTHATRDLCSAMLADSGHIQERDVEFVNKQRARRGETPVAPLYTQQDALDSLDYFVSYGYNRKRQIAPGVQLTFRDAGHMLGSAITVLDIAERDTGRELRLVFTGDLGRHDIPIIRDPEVVDRADVLIMESTYGDRLHESYPDAEAHLERIINDAYRRGGVIVMPAFAVGRTQQIVLALHQLAQRGDIPSLPIYVDSPLAVDVTEIFRLHFECYDDEMRAFINETGSRDPFGFSDLTYVRSVEDSKRLNFIQTPCIIISASGMAEFGRVLHHLKNRIEDPRTTVLITSWQAPHTLGRRLVEKAEVVRIFGEEYRNNARVEVLNGFSGHADRDEMLAWVGAMKERPEQVFLVHGEEEAAFALQGALKERFGLRVTVPEFAESFEI